jgi:hypothetical protein
MKAIRSSETSGATQRTTRRHIPEDDTLHNHRCENVKSYLFQVSILALLGKFNGNHAKNQDSIFRIEIRKWDLPITWQECQQHNPGIFRALKVLQLKPKSCGLLSVVPIAFLVVFMYNLWRGYPQEVFLSVPNQMSTHQGFHQFAMRFRLAPVILSKSCVR